MKHFLVQNCIHPLPRVQIELLPKDGDLANLAFTFTFFCINLSLHFISFWLYRVLRTKYFELNQVTKLLYERVKRYTMQVMGHILHGAEI